MKEVSTELAIHPPRSEKKNPVAVDLGMTNDENAFEFDERNRYRELLKCIDSFNEGRTEPNDFEEQCREMLNTSAYVMYTVDKLVQAIVKQAQLVVLEQRSMEMIDLYYHDRSRSTTSSRQEAMYRLTAECHVDDNLFRIEQFTTEHLCTMQILAKNDHFNDESITAEEKWSLYVDHFVQLSTTEGVRLKGSEPFLKRTLPESIPEDPPTNIETQSGLELKICVNTYKIFFVHNTEDFFKRFVSDPYDIEVDASKRSAKFHEWLETQNLLE